MITAGSVRRLAASDLAVLSEAHPALRELAPQWLTEQERGLALVLVAWAGTTPAGSAQLVLHPTPPELRNVGVFESFRGNGHGTRLIEAAEREAAGYGAIRIGVGTDNPDARRLYERLGYRGTGELTTTTYSYLDDDGLRRTATETAEELIKTL